MRVREARFEDAAAIARVHVASWQTAYRGILPDSYLDALEPERREPMWRELLAREDAHICIFVTETEAGMLTGFASGGPARVEIPLPQAGREMSAAQQHFDGELYAIYLLAEHRRQGAGRLLTGAVARWLFDQGMASMLVWVLEANPSRAFYERLGGVPAGQEPITIANLNLVEVAYGWPDIRALSTGS
jgi:GNAT superfamily N-acetyltransferase